MRLAHVCALSLLACGPTGNPSSTGLQGFDAGPGDRPNQHCDVGAVPTDEVCDSYDNDCNGIVDDDLYLPNPAGCGSMRCFRGKWIEGGPDDVGASPEQCNNHDDNCDGTVDENLHRADPANTCRAQTCVNGDWVYDDGGTGANDDCDGIDNDCDGAIDEDFGPGACFASCGGLPSLGAEVCEGGKKVCRPQDSIFSFEICNGKDDDCDEFVDDNVMPQPCACGSGTQMCVNGSWVGDCGKGCTIGSSRWCDDPIYCHWGTQTCVANPDGTGRWGDCFETESRPGDCSGDTKLYDRACCLTSGQCCQDAFDTWESVGNCASQCPL